MQSLQHILPKRFPSTATVIISQKLLLHRHFSLSKKKPSSAASADDDWNDAWESAWLPNDSSTTTITTTTTPPWENSATAIADTTSAAAAAANDDSIDADTKAFVAEMDDRWSERRAAKKQQQTTNRQPEQQQKNTSNTNDKDVYRLRKQRIHAGLWMKEIDKLEESRLGGGPASADDIDRLLDSCSEIFDSGNIDMNDLKTPSTSDLKTKPDGWETTLKTQDGTIWDISQREEDILLQEFERRIAFSKFQIASFIKSHIFSRRRPVDGWKYMIEELGPNARRGKGSVQRLPSLADPSTQPFKEEKPSIAPNATSFRRR